MSIRLDEGYWTQRYDAGETGWDAGTVTTPLKTYFDQVKNTSLAVLIPGAGNAHEAKYLLDLGFTNITICDISIAPINNLAARAGNLKSLKLIHGDFFDLKDQYDLIIEQTFFCALHPTLRNPYFLKMQQLLRPGGKLAGVLFDDALNNDRPPFGGTREEYMNYIPQDLEIVKFEKCINSIQAREGREIFMLLKKAPSHP